MQKLNEKNYQVLFVQEILSSENYNLNTLNKTKKITEL